MIQPVSIFKTPAGELGIEWNDGTTSTFNLHNLRAACPCALCVDEITGQKILDPAAIPENIGILKVRSIGRYAIGIYWSDGHQSGIYPYSLLKQLTK